MLHHRLHILRQVLAVNLERRFGMEGHVEYPCPEAGLVAFRAADDAFARAFAAAQLRRPLAGAAGGAAGRIAGGAGNFHGEVG